MSVTQVCDVCHSGYAGNGRSTSAGRATVRYMLRRYEAYEGAMLGRATLNHRGRYVSAGSIDLCASCWDSIAKPRTHPERAPGIWRNQHSEGEAWRADRRPTHCPQGHPYSESNTLMDGSTRRCRICRRVRHREYMRRWRAR